MAAYDLNTVHFMSLRPNPLTADPHVSTGSTPGIGVIKIRQGGKGGTFGAARSWQRLSIQIMLTGLRQAEHSAIDLNLIGGLVLGDRPTRTPMIDPIRRKILNAGAAATVMAAAPRAFAQQTG